jgi:hypothetical protein
MVLSKPVLINGIYYNSTCIAGRVMGVCNLTIINRINSKNFLGYSFCEYRPPNYKTCPQCMEVKLLEEFKLSKHNRDGRSAWCKKCNSTYSSRYVNKQLHNINNQKYVRTEKGSAVRKATKERRRAFHKNNTPLTLSKEERQYINYLYWKMKIMRKNGFDVHVDHIIPISKGGLHIPENLQIIPGEDNLRKTNKIIK